ncbi:MAG: RNA methyltransferase [Deltaproteobacteria bacterium]|nr:RNA methyltransferase [Deltaproteobacteria bacterium]
MTKSPSKPGLRRGTNEIVVFGRHPVEAALASEWAEVARVEIVRSRPGPERDALRKLCLARAVPFEELSRVAMDAVTGAPRHDQGIAARVRLLRVMELDALIDATKGRAARRPMRVLALDGVTNSQNVGMVVRSVVAAGFDGLLWPMVGAPWINGLVVRAAAGAIFECPIACCDTLAAGLSRLQGAGFEVSGLDAGADASLFETPPAHRAVYVLGSESQGLSPDVAALLDRRLSIPMARGVESLNVAVAAGLVCYHARGSSRPAVENV